MTRILALAMCLATIGCGEKLPRTAHVTNAGKNTWCVNEFAGLTDYVQSRGTSPDKITGIIVGGSFGEGLGDEAYMKKLRNAKKLFGYLQVVTPQNEFLEVQFWDSREEVIHFVKHNGNPFFNSYHVIIEFNPNSLNGLDYYQIKEFTTLAKCYMTLCDDGVTRFAFAPLK